MSNTKSKLLALKKILLSQKIDYFILPNSDQFMNEYLPENAKLLEFVSGFTGSNAFVILGGKENKSAFFTDGRYTIQAASEVDEKLFEIYNLSAKSPLNWLLENVKADEKIGFDPTLQSINQIKFYQEKFGERLIALEKNPLDEIWLDRPKFPKNKIFEHPLKYAGESSDSKIKKIISGFKKEADALILTSPISICWLFNIRGSDVEYTPIPLCFAIIYKNGECELFTNNKTPKLQNIAVFKLKDFDEKFSCRSGNAGLALQNINTTIQIDFDTTNFWVYSLLQNSGAKIINKTDPCLILKAIKNNIEIKNALKAHRIDGLAVTHFLFWLENAAKNNQKIDEISAAKKLLEFRKKNKAFLYPSFETISGFGSNGAIVHYRATKESNKKFNKNNLYLIDSGGQYFLGTTDITRTIAIGEPIVEQKNNFTLVLKGHIALATAKFKVGTCGSDLDFLARSPLQNEGKDYEHGTGHGVGSFLSVHEGPCSISKRKNNTPLIPGMILSNEPGYYETNKYGIRIENLILVEDSSVKNQLQLKTITLAPIDPNLINFAMLDKQEKLWLKNYHQEIYQKLNKELGVEEKIWLQNLRDFYQKQ